MNTEVLNCRLILFQQNGQLHACLAAPHAGLSERSVQTLGASSTQRNNTVADLRTEIVSSATPSLTP
jgi:hypothetical protein